MILKPVPPLRKKSVLYMLSKVADAPVDDERWVVEEVPDIKCWVASHTEISNFYLVAEDVALWVEQVTEAQVELFYKMVKAHKQVNRLLQDCEGWRFRPTCVLDWDYRFDGKDCVLVNKVSQVQYCVVVE